MKWNLCPVISRALECISSAGTDISLASVMEFPESSSKTNSVTTSNGMMISSGKNYCSSSVSRAVLTTPGQIVLTRMSSAQSFFPMDRVNPTIASKRNFRVKCQVPANKSFVHLRFVAVYIGDKTHGYSPPMLEVRIKLLFPLLDSGDRRK